MFGNRRRRATSNPPLNGSNVNPSAATAAAQAFLSHQASNASLSSAAAAAALRSRPTTPIDVSAVQTKRTMRRSESTSSMGSGISGRRGSTPNLERRPSTGSMSERTLRDQSPNRSSPVIRDDAPPVPAIPQNIRPNVPAKSHRRAASLDAPPMRIASPPPNPANGRGSSLQPAAGPHPPVKRNRKSSLSSVQELTGIERPESRGSVNFSYPTNCERAMSPVRIRRLTSPSPSRRQEPMKIQNSAGLIYDPNTRSFLPAAEIYAIEESLRQAVEGPTKRKKNAVPKGANAGSHLADGTANGRPKGTAVDAMDSANIRPAQPTNSVQPISASVREPETASQEVQPPAAAVPKKKKVRAMPFYEDPDSSMSNTSDYDTDTSDKKFNTRAAALLVKKPSIVREERELEEQEAIKPSLDQNHQMALSKLETGSNTSLSTGSPSPTPQPRSIPKEKASGRGKALASADFSQERQGTRAASQPPPTILDNAPISSGGLPVGRGKGAVREGRGQSASPVRTTRFSTTPEVPSTLTVLHQPPARSISPRKSAMKHSPSPRGPSPVGQVSGDWNNHYATSEASDSSAMPDDITGARKKKKNARVSFDDSNNVVVGLAAENLPTDSPIVPSPQTTQKRGWFSHVSRGKKRDPSVVEDDEMMKPRPALPSFGSIREKKVRDIEDRPLVTPSDPLELSKPSSPSITSPTGEILEDPLGTSKDHAVGAILAHHHSTKNAANISKSREPIPPEVTSVEGSGYVSDSGSSDYDDTNNEPGIGRSASVRRGPPGVDAEEYRALASPSPNHSISDGLNGNVPQINLQQPTPTLENADDQREWPQVPGEFPGEFSGISESVDDTVDEVPHIIDHQTADITPSGLGIAEPLPEGAEPGALVPGEVLAHNLHHQSVLEEIEEDSDRASIYDDAPEDLTEPEGDGFLSLNAVADSPVSDITPGLALSTPPESPTIAMAKDRAYRRSLVRQNSEPDPNEGWEKAQQYWKGLTEEKKRALEAEARGGPDVESSEDEQAAAPIPPQPKSKPKKKTVVLQEPPAGRRDETAANTARNTAANTGVVQQRTYDIQPGTKAGLNGITPPMRSSMRSPPPNTSSEPHMKKTMRSSGTTNGGSLRGSMRGSMRDAPENTVPPPKPRGSLQKKYRPMSYQESQQAEASPVQPHKRNVSADSTSPSSAAIKQAQAMMAPNLTRRNSAGSDSSFTRAKGVKSGSMRQSMRSSSAQLPISRPSTGDDQLKSSRFSMRSLSPSGSTFRKPFNAGGGPPVSMMQSTMRNRPDSSSSSFREGKRGQSSNSGFLGFGKAPKAQTKPSKPVRSSRFADSSDEDDERPAMFHSRFVDSSDEDEPAPVQTRGKRMSTLRPIPRASGVADGDSSDLPDSDDEKPPTRSVGKTASPISPGNSEGAALTGGTLRSIGSGRDLSSSVAPERPNQKRRGSIMSILRRKKDPELRVRKSDAESPARRDTRLERNPSELAHVRQNSGSRPSTPRLQKRNGPNRGNSDTWPLRTPPKIMDDGDEKRPATADDAAALNGNGTNGTSARPEIGGRRTTATGVSSVDIVGGVGPKKKKRFPKLRKALGLHD